MPNHRRNLIELVFEHILNNVQVFFNIRRSWTKHPKGGKDTRGTSVDKWFDDALTKTWMNASKI